MMFMLLRSGLLRLVLSLALQSLHLNNKMGQLYCGQLTDSQKQVPDNKACWECRSSQMEYGWWVGPALPHCVTVLWYVLTDQKLGSLSLQHYNQVSIFPGLLVWPSKKPFIFMTGVLARGINVKSFIPEVGYPRVPLVRNIFAEIFFFFLHLSSLHNWCPLTNCTSVSMPYRICLKFL